MKAAVTGATGFIGQRLAARLGASGDVVALGLAAKPEESRRAEWLAAQGIEAHAVDITDSDALAERFAGCEAVFHLAAAQHEAGVPDAHFEKVNVGGAASVLEACRRAGVRHLVYGSTIGVYGQGADGVLDEASPPAPDNIYGETKLAAERLLAAEADGVRVAIARISETYGPGDYRLLKLYRGIGKGRFPRIGPGTNPHQPVYVEDLVDGLLTLARPAIRSGEAFILAGPEAVTTSEMLEQVAAAMGARRIGPRLPMWPFLAMAVTLENTLGRVGVEPPLHRRRLDFFRKRLRFDISKARESAGYAPKVGFAEGARLTLDWYRSEGLV